MTTVQRMSGERDMASEATVKLLKDRLFGVPGRNVYAILDGASVPELRMKLWEHGPQHACLFRGDLEPDMAEVAPYLVKLKAESDFCTWLLAEGWGRHWGVFALSAAGLLAMRKHFTALVDVYDEDGNAMIFRYYDPRVLRTFLPTCTPAEIDEVSGPASELDLEDEDPKLLLTYTADGGELRKTSVPVGK